MTGTDDELALGALPSDTLGRLRRRCTTSAIRRGNDDRR
jgi:hypothetical protein